MGPDAQNFHPTIKTGEADLGLLYIASDTNILQLSCEGQSSLEVPDSLNSDSVVILPKNSTIRLNSNSFALQLFYERLPDF